MFPHQIHGILRSAARIPIQRQQHRRTRQRCGHHAPWREPLRPEQKLCPSTGAYHARVDDIYPASLQPGHAAGKTTPAPIHSIQTPQQGPEPQPNYVVCASLPLHSWLQCNTKRGAATECVALTDTQIQLQQVAWIIAGPACICGLCSLESKCRHFQPTDEGINDSHT
jgi:hypothetical protein